MSRTKKGAKGPGYEYWSRRPAKSCTDPGKENKTITHRLERAAAKRELKRAQERRCKTGCLPPN
jgi:DMSO/TMAO reductase YedYZ molybdopterin-dependent catalytic subunit